MPIKDPVKRREHHRKYMKRRLQEDPDYKDKHNKRVQELSKERRLVRKNIILEIKRNPCTDCGNVYHHSMMEFDHKPEFKKSFDIGSGGTAGSVDALMKEISKCDLVCSNCHSYRTWLRRQPEN